MSTSSDARDSFSEIFKTVLQFWIFVLSSPPVPLCTSRLLGGDEDDSLKPISWRAFFSASNISPVSPFTVIELVRNWFTKLPLIRYSLYFIPYCATRSLRPLRRPGPLPLRQGACPWAFS